MEHASCREINHRHIPYHHQCPSRFLAFTMLCIYAAGVSVSTFKASMNFIVTAIRNIGSMVCIVTFLMSNLSEALGFSGRFSRAAAEHCFSDLTKQDKAHNGLSFQQSCEHTEKFSSSAVERGCGKSIECRCRIN